MAYPLAGLKVLDMSRVLAGPFAGRMLSDLGAEVVKLEPPEGDVTRLWGRKIAGISGYFNQQNAGKRNISLDLRQAEGVELVKRLAASADVLIENFRPDVMPRFGLDYATLAALNPRLVMLSISGFGAGNSDSRRAAYAPVVHAEVGLVARQAELSQSFPSDMALSIADTNASLHGLVGLLSALYAREQSGQGDHVEIAMVDATLVTNDGMAYALDGLRRPAPNRVWQTAGGNLMLAGEFRYIWSQLSKVEGLTDGLPEGATLEQKIAAREAAATTFFKETCSNRQEVIDALDRMNIAWGDVRDPMDVEALPSVQARQSVVEVDDRDGGTRKIPQAPYRFAIQQAGVRGGTAHLGEHNQEVLREWLEFDDGQCAAYDHVLIKAESPAS